MEYSYPKVGELMDKQYDSDNIIMTPYIQDVMERAKLYLKAGLPVHLMGPAGTGKTTMAMKLAKDWGTEYHLIQGDESFSRSDLVGGLFGYYQKVVEDNFISSVSKVERKLTPVWVDNPLAVACREGSLVLYDEFTRAQPETNNVLLGIISERVIMTTDRSGRLTLENVNPNFALILTSNPEEYVGVNKAQDALIDRIVTIRLSEYDIETEALITAKQAEINKAIAMRIVKFVKNINQQMKLTHSTTRSSIMIGKVYRARFLYEFDKKLFFKCCQDIFGIEALSPDNLIDIWDKGDASSNG
jgi:nitric oxide reductase NorQ protein